MIRQAEPLIFFPLTMQNSILNINKMVSMPFYQVNFVKDLVMIAIDIPKHITNFSRDQTSAYFQKLK